MTAAKPTHHLTVRIIIAMILGAVLGSVLFYLKAAENVSEGVQAFSQEYLIDGVLAFLGSAFFRALQLIVVPLVLVSLVCGTAGMSDLARLGRVGGKTVLIYLGTTALAIIMALTVALFAKPGVGLDLEQHDVNYTANEAPSLFEVLINIIPSNPFAAFVHGEMLQIIVFAILLGIAISMSGEPGKRILAVFEDFNEILLKLVGLIILVAPFGVFGLIGQTFAIQGPLVFLQLAHYFVVVLVLLLLHGFVFYPLVLKVLGRLPVRPFLRKMRTVQLFAFSTSSSNATLPVTLRTVEKDLGVHRSVGSFTVPLGATINMDGTAIMQGVATVFIAQAYGVDLSVAQILMVVLTATLASIGTAGVPGVGMLMLAMVLTQVQLPVEAIGIILGVDRLLDMVRTAVNVTGDAMVSCVVAKSEDALDLETYLDDGDGEEAGEETAKTLKS